MCAYNMSIIRHIHRKCNCLFPTGNGHAIFSTGSVDKTIRLACNCNCSHLSANSCLVCFSVSSSFCTKCKQKHSHGKTRTRLYVCNLAISTSQCTVHVHMYVSHVYGLCHFLWPFSHITVCELWKLCTYTRAHVCVCVCVCACACVCTHTCCLYCALSILTLYFCSKTLISCENWKGVMYYGNYVYHQVYTQKV